MDSAMVKIDIWNFIWRNKLSTPCK